LDNEKAGYHAAPKKKATADSPAKSTDDQAGPSEEELLKEEN